MHYRLITLGDLRLERDGAAVALPVGKVFALLVRVALEPEGVRRSVLARHLWPSADRGRARQSLRQALASLRNALEPEVFADEDPVRLDPNRVSVDVQELEEALASGRLEAAMDVWRGPFLESFAVGGAAGFNHWADEVRLTLERDLSRALVDGARTALAAGDLDRARTLADRAFQVSPYSAAVHEVRLESILADRDTESAEAALREAEEYLEGVGDSTLAVLRGRLAVVRNGLEWERAEGPSLEFTGRTRELAGLSAAWRQVQLGRRQVVAVLGPMGVGKTRLIREFLLLARSSGAAVARAGATALERDIELAGVAELAEQLLELPGAAGTAPASDALLRTLVPGRAQAAGPPRPSAGRPANGVALADALSDLIGAVSYEAPLVLAIDDAHHVDPASLALLTRVARRRRAEPVLFLFGHRETPADDDAFHFEQQVLHELDGRVIRLEPLTPAEMAEALLESGLVRDDDEARTAAVVLHPITHGNLFHLEEVLDALRDRGSLTRTEGSWRLDVPSLADNPPALPNGAAGAAAKSATVESETTRGRRRIALAAAAVVVLLGLASIALALRPDNAGPPPFGGGVILAAMGDSLLEVVPQSGSSPEWTVRPSRFRTPPQGGIIRVRRLTTGELAWYANAPAQDGGPDILRIHPTGRTDTVVSGPGDDDLRAIFPDGTRILYTREDRSAAEYTTDLFLGPADGGQARKVKDNVVVNGMAGWSPDGDRIAVAMRGAVDSLVILTGDGRPLRAHAFQEVGYGDWCGDRIVTPARIDGPSRLVAVTDSGAIDLGRYATGTVLCSPDGRAAVYRTLQDGFPALVVHDLDADTTRTLDLPARANLVAWLPDSVAPVPVRVALDRAEVSVPWGGHRILPQSVVRSDSSTIPGEVYWQSEDPGVAFVGSDGVLWANNPGRCRVVGAWGASIRDTFDVVVTGRRPANAALHEPFETLDTTRWLPFGSDPPVAATADDGPVLELRGDEKYEDGIASLDPLSWRQGITAELEFRLRPTEPVHQDIRFCLVDGAPRDIDRATGTWGPQAAQRTCFAYPGGDLARFDASEVGFSVRPGWGRVFRVPDLLPTDDWVHVALQIRPDGQVSLHLDRSAVAISPARFRIEPEKQWTVVVYGAAVGTRVLVRNLRVWSEARYPGL